MATTTNFGWTTPDDTALVKNGASAIRTLGSAIDTSLGGAWTSWTPSWTNLTIGNATVDAKYKQINKSVFFELRMVYGSTTSISGGVPAFSLPVTGRLTSSGKITGFIEDVGTNAFILFPNTSSTNVNCYCVRVDATYAGLGATSSTVPMTWTNGDILACTGLYEAA